MHDACALCGGIGQRIDTYAAQGAPCEIARGFRLQPSPDLEHRDRGRRQATGTQQGDDLLVCAFPLEKVQEDIRIGDDYSVIQGVTRLARTRLRRPLPLNAPTTSSASAMSSAEGAGGSEPSSSSATWSRRRRAQSESEIPARSAARIHLALRPAGVLSSTRSSALARMPYIVRTEAPWGQDPALAPATLHLPPGAGAGGGGRARRARRAGGARAGAAGDRLALEAAGGPLRELYARERVTVALEEAGHCRGIEAPVAARSTPWSTEAGGLATGASRGPPAAGPPARP